MANILIMGCGDLGCGVGERLAAAGHSVWGLRRQPERIPEPIRPLAGDFACADALPPLPPALDTVYFIATPGEFTEEAYRRAYVDGLRNTLAALEQGHQRPRRIVFVSSTSVFGADDGRWVDETSPAEPTRFSGRCLLEAEQLLADSAFAGVVVRFGGIYGPGREYHLRKVREGVRGQHEAPVWTNRIHREDCVGLLTHLFHLDTPEPLYLGVDDAPALRHELLGWLAQKLAIDPPGTPPMPAGDVRGKRCRNDRLHASGYRLRYPDYRTGYRALLDRLATT
ncbi:MULTISPECIES: SDR family oxidoreductase [unclassified Thioalkalivibrio]|uniref:SDR family oxidoreductase n=1 Tax=unclassified Thioalkalivibrio TaxID=2621013 RepID=UPI0003670595|nr:MULTISPECIES: SDR family oxidoreductase [unclassified Thioalkalivibrio]